MAAAATGLIAFTLILAGGLLLWGTAHYKDADGYFSTGSERFGTSAYAITADDLEGRRRRPRVAARGRSLRHDPAQRDVAFGQAAVRRHRPHG